ncbi:uncharacterized protein LOC127006482 [Eriocheir sinensis]|uniref:uncharacterized protein LOC127006482 n=1 Tax=Eriocheir sinensis TaxID=95602 RepID=UPI0021C8AA8C|nr:uncharacterized protein LOC127006482 [Eriocheir sinensis]
MNTPTKMMVMMVMMMMMMMIAPASSIRVDDKRGFALCNIPQTAQLERVEVSDCKRWPCLAKAGRRGTYEITFTPDTNEPIRGLKSDIHAWVKLPYGDGEPIRFPMPRQIKQEVCPFLDTPCPVPPGHPATITKSVTIPVQARMAQGNVVVEFRVTDDLNRVVTCFHAPVIVA